jgi:hypothetical protein
MFADELIAGKRRTQQGWLFQISLDKICRSAMPAAIAETRSVRPP